MKKADTNDYILFCAIYIKFQKRQNYTGTKQIGGCQMLGLGVGINCKGTMMKFLKAQEMFHSLIVTVLQNHIHLSKPIKV